MPFGNHQNRLSHLDLHSCEPDELTDDEIIRVYELNTSGMNTDDSSMPSWEDPVSVFFSVTKPRIEPTLYFKRLARYAQCSRASFIFGLVKLHRLCMTPYNMHRLLISSIILEAKTMDDRCYSNTHYAGVGGMKATMSCNLFRMEMLKFVKWSITFSLKLYKLFANSALNSAGSQSVRHELRSVIPAVKTQRRSRFFTSSGIVAAMFMLVCCIQCADGVMPNENSNAGSCSMTIEEVKVVIEGLKVLLMWCSFLYQVYQDQRNE